MRCTASTGLVIAMSLALGCDEARSEAKAELGDGAQQSPVMLAEPEAPEPPRAAPAWLVVPWGARLHAAPDFASLRLTLPKAGEHAQLGAGALFRVVGETDTGWWQLESVSLAPQLPPEQGAKGEQPLAGLEVFALTLYVPAGTGSDAAAPPSTAAEPEPEPVAAPTAEATAADAQVSLQSGEVLSGGSRYVVPAGAAVFWPDGRDAGVVRHAHAFAGPGERRVAGAVPAMCFPIVYGPATGRGKTELCYEASAVSEARAAKRLP